MVEPPPDPTDWVDFSGISRTRGNDYWDAGSRGSSPAPCGDGSESDSYFDDSASEPMAQ